jgi:tRNA(Ile)-lysidine synthetase-like protein
LLEAAAGRSLVADLDAVAQTALSLHTLVDAAADRILGRWACAAAEAGPPGAIAMPLEEFLNLPEPVRFGLLRLAAHRISPRQVPLAGTAYNAVLDALCAPRPGRPDRQEWALGSGARLRREGSSLVVEREDAPAEDAGRLAAEDAGAAAGGFSIGLPVPGAAELPDGSRIRARVTDDVESVRALLARKRTGRETAGRLAAEDAGRLAAEDAGRLAAEDAGRLAAEDAGRLAAEDADAEVLDADSASGPLLVRTRRPGDVFHPLGAPGVKKLKDFLIDSRVPLAERDTLPLVCRGDEILWVAGRRIGESVRVTSTTRRFLVLRREPVGDGTEGI